MSYCHKIDRVPSPLACLVLIAATRHVLRMSVLHLELRGVVRVEPHLDVDVPGALALVRGVAQRQERSQLVQRAQT